MLNFSKYGIRGKGLEVQGELHTASYKPYRTVLNQEVPDHIHYKMEHTGRRGAQCGSWVQ